MKPLSLYILLTGSLLLLLPKKVVNACGFYVSPGEYRFWLLQPDLTNTTDLTPFFFASTYLYKGNHYASASPHIQQNINEWYTEIKRKATKADIDTILYDTDPQIFFESAIELSKRNSFMHYLVNSSNKALYQYLIISKKIEQIAANPDPWDERRLPLLEINKLIDETNSLLKLSKSKFIQLRCPFQLIRLYAFNNDSRSAEFIYQKYIASIQTNSWIKAAALYQKTISFPSADYNYQLSKVFDLGTYNRTSCLVRFNSKELDSIMTFAKNTHERNVLMAMKVFNYPGRSLTDLKTIYAAEPTYKELPFLLLREINKIEDWLITNKITEFNPAVYGDYYYNYNDYDKKINYKQDINYANSLYSFINRVINENKIGNKGLWHLYAAHLKLLLNDYNASEIHLELAEKSNNTASNVKTQIKINKFLLSIHLNKTFTATQENELLAILKTSAAKLAIYDADIMKDQLILFTAKKLINNGERVKGLMLLCKTKRAFGQLSIGVYKTVYQEIADIATSEDYDRIIETMEKKNKSLFERFISEGTFSGPQLYYDYYEYDTLKLKWDKNNLLDLKATRLINNKDLKGALLTLKKIPVNYWKQEPYTSYLQGDPFYFQVYQPHSVTTEDKRKYNKKETIERMIYLEELARSNKTKAAECYYQLGNAWYNMSYHGKSWLMVRQWWSINDLSNYNEQLEHSAFNEDYMGCKQAKEYYLKAFNITNDKNLATLSCFMAGVCDRNFKKYNWCIANKDNYNKEFKTPVNPYKKLLGKKNIDDQYYEEIITECATYNNYINKYNRIL